MASGAPRKSVSSSSNKLEGKRPATELEYNPRTTTPLGGSFMFGSGEFSPPNVAAQSRVSSRQEENETPPIIHDVEDDDEQEKEHVDGEDKEGGNKIKSPMFRFHFTRVELPNGQLLAKCRYCKSEFKMKKGGGYGTISRHLHQKHPTEAAKTMARGQTQISRFSTPQNQLFIYDDEKNKECLTRMICQENLPFIFSEKLGFVDYCQEALNPQAHKFSRKTIRREAFKQYAAKKNELSEFFSKYNGRVTICSDIWSETYNDISYMGVTCHYIDQFWEMQKRTLAFRVFNETHTAENIFKLLSQILTEYCLIDKVFALGFDNAMNNTAAIPRLKELCGISGSSTMGLFFHQRCACHVINLCVQSGLEFLEIYIGPIKAAVKFIWQHPSVTRAWREFCKSQGKHPKKFPKDVRTRWNSTYKLLRAAHDYKDLLINFIMHTNIDICLQNHHFEICERLIKLLKVFNNTTETFSHVYQPTSNLFILQCIYIVNCFAENTTGDEHIDTCIFHMKEKWCHYYFDIPLVYQIAFILDPRCRLENLRSFFEEYYGYIGQPGWNNTNSSNYINIDLLFSRASSCIFQLYREFAEKYGSGLESSSSQSSNVVKSSFTNKALSILKKSRTLGSASQSSSPSNELQNYLTTAFEYLDSENFDVLTWWRDHEQRFPILAQLAKQVLSMPVSTVAVEQEFSDSGNTITDHRTSLYPETIEVLICNQDWARARRRQQELQSSKHFMEESTGDSDDDE